MSSNVVGGGCPDLRAGGGGGRKAVVRPPARVDAQPQDHLVLGQRKELHFCPITNKVYNEKVEGRKNANSGGIY